MIGTVLGAMLTRRVAGVMLNAVLTAGVAAAVSSGVVSYDAVCGTFPL
jgi:hypothetical protein